MRSGLIVLFVLVLAPGCYQRHGPSATLDATPRERDAGTRDAGTRDGGVGDRDAGSRDAGPLLPPEPDPDLGPDSRPSDYPDADDWDEPPDIGADDPCCVLSDPVRLTSRDEGMALAHDPPLIEWGPGLWGLAVTRYFLRSAPDSGNEVVLWQLASDGTPTAEPRALDTPPVATEDGPTVRALRWAEGRWAVAVSGIATGGPTREMHGRLLDRDLRPATSWLALGVASDVDLARLSHGDLWLGLAVSDDLLRVTPFSDWGAGRALEHPANQWGSVRAVGLRSRAAVLLSQVDERRPPGEIQVVGAGPEHAILGRVPLATRHTYSASLTALRDLVVAFGVTGGRVQIEVVDPFALTQVAAPRTIGDIGIETPRDNSVDIAGSDKLGLAGVCYGIPAGEPGVRGDSRVDFRLVGPDGAPRGAAVTVVSGEFRGSIVNCSVGSDERGFLVGWWDGSELWVRRVDVAR